MLAATNLFAVSKDVFLECVIAVERIRGNYCSKGTQNYFITKKPLPKRIDSTTATAPQ